MPPLAFGEVSQFQRTDSDSDEAEDFDLMGFTQAANVTVAAFIQQDLQPGIFFPFTQEGGAFGSEEAVFGAGPGFELAQ